MDYKRNNYITVISVRRQKNEEIDEGFIDHLGRLFYVKL